MRRYLFALAVALVALSGAARVYSALPQSTLAVVIGYDLDSTSFVYPVALGPTAVPSTVIRPQAVEGWYEPVSAPSGAAIDRRIKTADYDPTVVSCVDSSSALEPLSAGDLVLTTDKYNRPIYASIFSKTDANTVEFDRSVELTQSGCAAYRYRKLEAGSEDYDGWFSIAGWTYNTIMVDIAQMNVTGGIDIQIECKAAHSLTEAQVLASSNITAAGGFAVAVPEPWDVCRAGFRIGTSDDDGTPADDNEKISVYAIRRE